MAAKDIKFKEEARQKILKGVQTLADAVKVTLALKDAMSSSTNPMALPTSQKTASLLQKKLSSKTSTKIWALKWSKKSPAKLLTKQAMARQLRLFLPKLSIAKDSATSLQAQIRWTSSAGWRKLSKQSSKS